MSESTLEKIQGARTIKDMILWAGLTQREIMVLETTMGNALEDNRGAGRACCRDYVEHDLRDVRQGATDAGIQVWNHGPAELNRDPSPQINRWTPSVDLDGPMPANPCPEPVTLHFPGFPPIRGVGPVIEGIEASE